MSDCCASIHNAEDVNCIWDSTGNAVTGSDKIKDPRKSYMEKLLNLENAWDKDVTSGKLEGPSCGITEAEVENPMGENEEE